MTKRNYTDARHPDGLDQMTDFQLIQAARADIAFWKLAIEEGMQVIGAESIADFEAKLNTFEKTVEAERLAHKAAAESQQRMERSADAYLVA